MAHEEVQAHGKDAQNQGLRQEADIIAGQHPDHDGQANHAESQPDPREDTAHGQALPNKPRGRSARIMAMGAKMVNMASSGSRARPKVSRSPTTRLPRKAPRILPSPPISTTTRPSNKTSKPAPASAP